MIKVWDIWNKFEEIIKKNNSNNIYNNEVEYLELVFSKSYYQSVLSNELNNDEKLFNSLTNDYNLNIKSILELKENINNQHEINKNIKNLNFYLKTQLDKDFFYIFIKNYDKNITISQNIENTFWYLSKNDLNPNIEDLDILLKYLINDLQKTNNINYSLKNTLINVLDLKISDLEITQESPIIKETLDEYNTYLDKILNLHFVSISEENNIS